MSEWMTYNLSSSDETYMGYEMSVDLTLLKNLIKDYDKVSMEDWFENEPIVEKKIPEFNFVK